MDTTLIKVTDKHSIKIGGWVACFDDANLTENLHCDLVINGASKQVKEVYGKTAPEAVHCVGPEYRVLRQEFTELPELSFEQRGSLTLVMGGSDPANLTLPLLNKLQQRRCLKARSESLPGRLTRGLMRVAELA